MRNSSKCISYQLGHCCMFGQIVHPTMDSAVCRKLAQGRPHLRLCAFWPGGVELTCTLTLPCINNQMVVILHFHSFLPIPNCPIHLNSLNNSLEMHKKARVEQNGCKTPAFPLVGFLAFLFTSWVCTDHLGTPSVSFQALKPWIVILANNLLPWFHFNKMVQSFTWSAEELSIIS